MNRIKKIESPRFILLLSILCLIVGIGVSNLTQESILYLIAISSLIGLSIVLFTPIFVWWKIGNTLFQPFTIFAICASGYVFGGLFLLLGGNSIALYYRLDNTDLNAFSTALFFAFVGVLLFYFSYRWALAKHNHATNNTKSTIKSSKTRLFIAIGVLSILGLLGAYLFISSSGGITFLAENINSRTSLRTTEYYQFLSRSLLVSSWVWWAFRPQAYKNPIFWGHFSCNIVILIVMGSAAPIVLYIASLVAIKILQVSIDDQKRIPYIRYMGLILLLVVVVMVGRIGWRRSAEVAQNDPGEIFSLELVIQQTSQYFSEYSNFLATSFGGANLASIEALSNLIEHVPNQIDYLYGETFLWALVSPIPRIWWPEKPGTTLGAFINQSLFDPGQFKGAVTGNVPVGWFGEMYLNFGFPGIILGALLFGYVSGRVYLWYDKYRSQTLPQLFYLTFSLYFVFMLTKTELKSAASITASYFVPLIFAFVILQISSSKGKA